MIHCGDQIYADIPARPVSDPAHYRKKYLDAWDDCRTARAFLTQTAQYMILDDHEIINNFDLDMNLPDVDHVALRNAAMQAYWEFQHKHNPDTSSAGGRREYYYSFSYGLTEFFVMDTRFRRSSKLGQMIDPVQLESFKAWLLEHKSRLKFIVTIVPFIGQLKRAGDDKWCSPCFAEQRSNILEFLHKNRIGKTVFLTGDMHTSYHAKAKISDGVYDLQIHELMSSPINQFTPDTDLEETYEPVHRFVMSDHLAVTGKITPNSFFGDHSSVMAISIKSDRVGYQVFRTSKPGGAITSRSFVP
jgi:phosphodiesterase/alkaline phosphatase D-like protein